MTRRHKNNEKNHGSPPPRPMDMVDGVPDVSPRRPAWKYALIAGVFAVWAGFLVYCAMAGNP